MPGILYGIGVGPGDPELMTLKAVRMIRENTVIACPGKDVKESTAYKIALEAVSELAEKELVPIPMPMVMDQEEQKKYHKDGAVRIESYLDQGKNVVFLTLGDPTIYSTFSYIRQIVETDGYRTQTISGVPSFCAAAAALGMSLAEWKEPLHIIPAVHQGDFQPDLPGNYVLMKSGVKIADVKSILKDSSRVVSMVENCGMADEKKYHCIEDIPDQAGYFSLLIVK